jgi:hypothetical protein
VKNGSLIVRSATEITALAATLHGLRQVLGMCCHLTSNTIIVKYIQINLKVACKYQQKNAYILSCKRLIINL